MTPKKATPAAMAGQPGQDGIGCLESTTAWCLRQAAKFALPWIAAIVTHTKFTARKSLFLDRLMVLAGGGGDDI
jgi:hypothetical protein